MPTFEKGAWFWLDSETEGFLPVKLTKEAGDMIVGVSAQAEQFSFKADKEMARVNVSSLTQVSNMVEMEELSEVTLTRTHFSHSTRTHAYTLTSTPPGRHSPQPPHALRRRRHLHLYLLDSREHEPVQDAPYLQSRHHDRLP